MGGGKDGNLYTLSTATMAKVNAPQNPQKIVASGHIMSGPVYWPRTAAAGGSLVFNSGENDVLRAFSFNGTNISSSSVAAAAEVNQGHPGGITALSANGQQAGSGILWQYARSVNHPSVEGVPEILPGILRAYDASNVANLLWTNYQNMARDEAGLFGKFAVPT